MKITLLKKRYKIIITLLIIKQKKRIITKPVNKKMQKGLQEYYRNLSEDEKFKKQIMLTIEIEIRQKCIEKKEKNI